MVMNGHGQLVEHYYGHWQEASASSVGTTSNSAIATRDQVGKYSGAAGRLIKRHEDDRGEGDPLTSPTAFPLVGKEKKKKIKHGPLGAVPGVDTLKEPLSG